MPNARPPEPRQSTMSSAAPQRSPEHMPLDGRIARWRPRASPAMHPANAEVPQPDEPATPAVPDAPITPAVPDPGTPTEPEDPATVPTPDEPATPIAPNPDPDVTATTPSVADVSLPTEHLKSDCKKNQLHAVGLDLAAARRRRSGGPACGATWRESSAAKTWHARPRRLIPATRKARLGVRRLLCHP